jgi:hypothetical protein
MDVEQRRVDPIVGNSGQGVAVEPTGPTTL